MTPVSSFRGKNVALFGLGVSGLATAKALIAGLSAAERAEVMGGTARRFYALDVRGGEG